MKFKITIERDKEGKYVAECPDLRGHEDKKEEPSTRAPILPDDIPLEFHVLLSACRTFLGNEEPVKLEQHLQKGPDWDRLLALASMHGVMPLLYRSIS